MSDPDRWVWLQAWRDLAEPKTSGVASYFASPKLVVGILGRFFFDFSKAEEVLPTNKIPKQ